MYMLILLVVLLVFTSPIILVCSLILTAVTIEIVERFKEKMNDKKRN